MMCSFWLARSETPVEDCSPCLPPSLPHPMVYSAFTPLFSLSLPYPPWSGPFSLLLASPSSVDAGSPLQTSRACWGGHSSIQVFSGGSDCRSAGCPTRKFAGAQSLPLSSAPPHRYHAVVSRLSPCLAEASSPRRSPATRVLIHGHNFWFRFLL